MKNNFDIAFAKLLQHEGKFSNHPDDTGGITMYGITKVVWEEWIGHRVDEKAMRNLTPEKVKPLYRRKYWDAVRADALPSGVDYCVFDAAVNSGPGRAIKWLQQAIGVEQDGEIGPITLAAVRSANPKEVIRRYSAIRLAFLLELPTWKVFGRGWERRVAEVRNNATVLSA